ncbi:hypothetical protein KQI52_15155 [bacterium]|nr:hypothetical protein [bacterium]
MIRPRAIASLIIIVAAAFTGFNCSLNLNPIVPPVGVRVQQIHDSLATAEEYWPGFDPAGRPVLLIRQTESWLMNHPNPPEGWSAVAGWESTVTAPGNPFALSSDGTLLINEIQTSVVYIDSADHDSISGYAARALHEDFDAYIRERFYTWTANEEELFFYPYSDKSLLKWQMIESEGLQEALKAVEKGQLDTAATWIAHAVKARLNFNAEAPPFASEYVRLIELQEGLPWYVDMRARQLEPAMLYMNSMYANADEIRRRAQVSGAARAFLLDEFFPDWKTILTRRANTNPDLNDLLRSVANRRGLLDDPLPESIIREYDRRAGGRIRSFNTRRRTLAYEWSHAQGYHLNVDLSEYPMIATGFDLFNVLRLEDDRLLHEKWLRLTNNRGTIEARNQWMMTSPAGEHPLFSGISRFEIAGLGSPPDVSEHGDTLLVRWNQGEIRLLNAQISDRSGVITIKL